MTTDTYPILEFDPQPEAVIEPGKVIRRRDEMPARAVLCFFNDVIERLCGDGRAEVVHHLRSEIGANPIYALEADGQRLAVCHPGVGAPLAAGFMEELIALGVDRFIACGGAGVLRPEIVVGHVILPTSAIRDEGTSYHYLPPGREVAPTPRAVAALEATLQADNVDYAKGKTWTTDAIYRETPGKVARRRAEGCLTVEMEAAAFFAVAQFRGVTFGQLLYGGDDVSGETWDSRHWDKRTPIRERLFWLAAEAVLRL
ncbi:MAG: nucleoside phosphorylase [Anaerolineae bacterium]